ncbi:HxlR-like helix-turn-helix [compost metagenome]
MEKRLYSERPPRYQYALTPRGQDLSAVLIALLTWGNNHLAPEGASIQLRDTQTGELVEPMLVDRRTGQEISPLRHTLVPGPAASDGMKQRLRHANGVMSGDNPSKQESES